MQNTDILSLWKTYDNKLETSLQFNKKTAEAVTKLRVTSFLSSMRPLKLFTIVVGLIWVIFVDTLIINLYSFASPFFIISAVIQVILTKIAIGIYIYQLVLMHQADISENIVVTQYHLAKIKSTTLLIARILFLQLPVWATFYLPLHIFNKENWLLLLITFIIVVAFSIISIWLFVNINLTNKDKKWFRLIFNGREWQPLIRSMELLEEIEAYQK